MKIPCGEKNSKSEGSTILSRTHELLGFEQGNMTKHSGGGVLKKWGYFSQNQRTQPGALVLNELWNRKHFHLFSGRWCSGQSVLYLKSPFIYNS